MGFNQKEIELAVEFAKTRSFKAELEGQSIKFIREPAEIPGHIREKLAEVIESCADYYERTIFMGEYEPKPDAPPFPEFKDVIEDINYRLEYFLEEYIFEVKKAVEADKISPSPFAQVMLRHRKLANKSKIEKLKKEQKK